MDGVLRFIGYAHQHVGNYAADAVACSALSGTAPGAKVSQTEDFVL